MSVQDQYYVVKGKKEYWSNPVDLRCKGLGPVAPKV